jgi:Zn-dependent membrane protease YugP
MDALFGYMMMWDPMYYVFLIPGLLLGMYAQFRLTSAYNQYIRTGLASNMSGADAARTILDRAGLHDVPVEAIPGHLTDHYDPMKKALFLSRDNFYNRSIAAVGVAAHEAGHALQHKAAYAPLQLRMAMVPITNFASKAVYGIFFLGLILGLTKLILAAVIAFAIITAFQLVTLPVEYDASRRAKQQLVALGIVQRTEAPAVSKVLNAAALTYVAALVTSLFTLLYYLSVFRGSSRD